MTQDEITEGNKLIAEFMGGKVVRTFEVLGKDYFSVTGYIVEKWRDAGFRTGGIERKMMLDNCKFESSWDWLMPVVEKINNYADVVIQLHNCYITKEIKHPRTITISDIDASSTIEATWQAVIEFINWHKTTP